MKIATTLTALALTFAPAIAIAGGCSGKMKDETASSCLPGYTWDSVTSACTPTPAS